MKMNCNLKTLTNFFQFFPCRSLSESLGIPSVLSLGALGKCLSQRHSGSSVRETRLAFLYHLKLKIFASFYTPQI